MVDEGLELKEDSGLSEDEIIDVDKKFIIGKPETFTQKIIEKIKEKEKIVVFFVDWKSGEDLEAIKGVICRCLSNNAKFCSCININNKNYICLEEMVGFLKEMNSKNIIFRLADNEEEMPRFGDVGDLIFSIINNTEFVIYLEGFPLCFLGENKDHSINLLKNTEKTQKCCLCELNSSCCGINKKYLKKYGDEEIRPLNKAKEAIIRIIRRLNEKSLIYISDNDVYFLLKEFSKEQDFWKAIQEIGYPIPMAIEILKELENEKLISITENNIEVHIGLKENKNKIKDYSESRILSNPDASQLTVEQKDIEKRVEYIIEKCPAGGNIVFLGDDDFISLSMASKRHFENITVLEFDEQIAGKIKEITEKEAYGIKVVVHDLRNRLPSNLTGKFDVFYTDSPYSLNGFALFISRGVELLKKEPKKQGFASFSCEMPEIEMVEMPCQHVIDKMNLFIWKKDIGASNVMPIELKKKSIFHIKNKLANLNKLTKQEKWYLAALARKEYLFHLLTTNQTKPLIKGDFYDELYYTEKALNFYVDEEFKKEIKKNPVFVWKKSSENGDKKS